MKASGFVLAWVAVQARGQGVYIYTVFDEEFESEVNKCKILELGAEKLEN